MNDPTGKIFARASHGVIVFFLLTANVTGFIVSMIFIVIVGILDEEIEARN